MFSTATVLIDQSVEEVYAFLANLRNQLKCWDNLIVPDVDNLPDNADKAEGSYKIGTIAYDCTVDLYLTRPGSGLVTRLSWTNGELAAEWRVMEDGDRTRVELNIEGLGGGLGSNVHVRHASKNLVTRLKQQFDRM